MTSRLLAPPTERRSVRLFGLIAVILGCLGVAGCRSEPATVREDGKRDAAEVPADDHAAHETARALGRSVPLAGLRGVSFSTVGQPRAEGAWFAGEAAAELNDVAVFSTPVAGIVTALRIEPGRRVAAGAALADIRSPELAEKNAAWLAARARHRQAEREVERERRLIAAGATSARELEAAEATAEIARAEEAAARLALAARGLEPSPTGTTYVVRAARSGILESYLVAVGQGVQSGGDLGRLIAPGARRVEVELPLPGPEGWPVGAQTEVRRADGRRFGATVEGIPAALSETTRRLTYRLRLLGDDLPLAGTPLEVRVPLARAIVVPQAAVQQIEGTWGVFVRDAASATFRPVRKGAELGVEVLVLDGLAPGETIATDGAYLLKSLSLRLAGDGGDEHDH